MNGWLQNWQGKCGIGDRLLVALGDRMTTHLIINPD